MAVNSHPLISAGRAQERALLADQQGAKWLRYPSVTVEDLAASRAKDGNAPNGTTPNLVAEMPLWTFDRIPETIARGRPSSWGGFFHSGTPSSQVLIRR